MMSGVISGGLISIALFVIVLALFHYAVRRGLAPGRMSETHTPANSGLDYREVHIATANGLTLFGWFIPAAGETPAPAVVLLHGWGGNAETLLPLAQPLRRAGFAVMLFDSRCHGRSDEDRFASMPRFAEDLEHVIDYLHHESGVSAGQIAIIGHSVGGGAALLVASRRKDLAAVVSIAAFAHPRTMMRRLLASKGIPYWPLGWYILHYVQHVIGHAFNEIAPLATISRVRCPTLLVHGAEDTTVPLTEAHAIYAARGAAPVQLKVVPGSHDQYHDVAQGAAMLVTFLCENTRCSNHTASETCS